MKENSRQASAVLGDERGEKRRRLEKKATGLEGEVDNEAQAEKHHGFDNLKLEITLGKLDDSVIPDRVIPEGGKKAAVFAPDGYPDLDDLSMPPPLSRVDRTQITEALADKAKEIGKGVRDPKENHRTGDPETDLVAGLAARALHEMGGKGK